MKTSILSSVLLALVAGASPTPSSIQARGIETCPGYKAQNVHVEATKVTADLVLAGTACNIYGTDLQNLVLEVNYETSEINVLTVIALGR